jgi:cysteine desulfurase
LDNNATTPVDPRVADVVVRYLVREYGNAGSRTHVWGSAAAKTVERTRSTLAQLTESRPDEVIFTSGATEANNLAILGLEDYGKTNGKAHIITSAIEHKAVLEPIEYLEKANGFEVSILSVDERGWPSANELAAALREDTLLVSTMHVNNETGVELPLSDYAAVLDGHPAWWHVDAAQGFGKAPQPLQNRRIDLISISGHKVFAPKGIGALIARRRDYQRPPITPLMYGGGQERGLRPGTLPVALIAGLGEGAQLAHTEVDQRRKACLDYRARVLEGLAELDPVINGDMQRTLPHVLNFSVSGIDAEAAMVVTKDLIAVSNGSACTSSSYGPSHVLTAMGLDSDRIAGALRLSWSHETPMVEWSAVVARLKSLLP